MQTMVRNGYSVEELKAVLHGPLRYTSFRFELLTSENVLIRELYTVLDGSVSVASLSDIKRTARFVLPGDEAIDFGSQRIKPYVRVWNNPNRAPAEFALGVFLLSTPTRRMDSQGVITREVEAYDQNQVLIDNKVTGRYRIVAGAGFIDSIRTLLSGAGITMTNLTPSTLTLPIDREWDMGTPRLTIINELLAAMNYDPLYFDENGYAVARPHVDPDLRASEYVYANDSMSVMSYDAQEVLDYFDVANQFVLVVSQPERPELKSIYTNANASSPTSTVSRGRTIVEVRQVDSPDQATLDNLARTAAYKASQVYQTFSFSTAIMPMHSHNDVFTITHSEFGINSKFEETGWTIQFKAGSLMSHSVRRVTNV